ncbi:MAG: glycosyltransferase family 39 protein [Acidobacteriota bacterium]
MRPRLALFVAAIVLYGMGIGWGIPETEPRERPDSWATDELAPAGLLEEIANTLYFHSGVYNPKYPFFAYVIQGIPTLPYYVASAGLDATKARTLAVARPTAYLARATTVLLAAATCLVAWETAAVLWGPGAGWIAGLLTLLFPPMFYYGRTTNVDGPALFFTAVALWQFALILRDGLNRTNARWLAISAALAIATKDTAFGAIVPAGIIVVVLEWKRNRTLLLRTGLLSGALYLVASGLVFSPGRYWQHIQFIRFGSTRHYGFHYGSTQPYWQVFTTAAGFVLEQLGVLVALLVAAGIALCWRSRPKLLLWIIPALGVVLLTILPARFVLYRFPIVTSYLLLFFAAFALQRAYEWRRAAGLLLVMLASAHQLARAVDITWLMWHDSRYEAGAWLARNAHGGERIGYYGTEPNKLPFTDPAIGLEPGPSALPAANAPEFLIVIPYQNYERVHEYNLPEETYQAMRSGSAGYRQILGIQTAPLLFYRPSLALNPPVKIFVRDDKLAALADRTPRITVPD